MSIEYRRPSEIERASLAIIREELERLGAVVPEENRAVVERVIHTTADFDYVGNLKFTEHAAAEGIAALLGGADIVTDTNMAKSGVSKPAAERLGCGVYCYISEPDVVSATREQDTTRAASAVRYAAERHSGAVFAVGNAPTALLELENQIVKGFRPALVIGVPVGFVNVVEAKERIFACCERCGVPAIVAMGRKGGSNVAAAICNALVYSAAGMLEPEKRGWN